MSNKNGHPKHPLETQEGWDQFIQRATDDELLLARDIVWQMLLKVYAKRGEPPPTPPWLT